MSDRPKVYLAGPAEVVDTWRGRAAKALDKLGFDAINPLRGERLKHDRRGLIGSDCPPTLMVVRDHFDMDAAKRSGGLILMSLNTSPEGREPTATLMELEYSYIKSIPVIAIASPKLCLPRYREHPWLEVMAAYRATSLTRALKVIEQYFCFEVGDTSKVELEEEDE